MKRLALAVILLLLASPALAQPASAPATAPAYETRRATPDGTGKFYFGREIAQVMGHQGADWLERPEREREEGTNLLVANMDLKPVDIQQEMLDLLTAKATGLGVKNVEPVLGEIDDPKLPHAGVDVALLVDAYHEFSHPREMMAALFRA